MDALDLTQRIKLSVMFNLETFIFTWYGAYKGTKSILIRGNCLVKCIVSTMKGIVD